MHRHVLLMMSGLSAASVASFLEAKATGPAPGGRNWPRRVVTAAWRNPAKRAAEPEFGLRG